MLQFFLSLSPKKILPQKKCPARNRGTSPALFLAKNAQSLRHRRVAWLTAFSADYSGGTAADFHGLPRCPCLQIENRVYVAHPGVSTRRQNPVLRNLSRLPFPSLKQLANHRLAIFPIRLPLFHQRAQSLLRILQPVQFIQENIHGIF